MKTLNIVVYGDVDLNLLDGSAVWAQSMVLSLADVEAVDVTLLLKAPVGTDRLIAPLEGKSNVSVRRPFEEQMLSNLSRAVSPNQLAQLLAQLDSERYVDAFVIRGHRIATSLAEDERFRGRLWTYLTDIPQSNIGVDPDQVASIHSIVEASARVLCQTEDLRSHLEQMVPAACGKTILHPPVVETPNSAADGQGVPTTGADYRLVYTGKMAPDWRTEQMTELPQQLAELDLDVEIHMVGDKIHDDRDDPGFAQRMDRALDASRVIRHGGVPRRRAVEIASACDIGLCWRSAALDSSLELSTKLLEFGTLGLPAIVNRTSAHQRLLGDDYELFIDTDDDVAPTLARALREPELLSRAGQRCRDAARFYEIGMATLRLSNALATLRPRRPLALRNQTRKVLVASHDLKFMTRLLEQLELIDGFEIRIDNWSTLSEHDEDRSVELLAWADVVVCEWCGPNAIWYSNRVRSDQQLVVRLHRFELYSRYPAAVNAEALDTVITVNPHYRDLVRSSLPWPADRIIDIPNWVDTAALERDKLSGSNFHVGMIGIAPRRKRLDIALDVMELVRAEDERFTLFVKTKMPWEYWWIWNDADEQRHYRDALRRVQTSPLLRGGVVFDPFGPDVGNWLRKIGSVLSTSDDESFHLSPAEGMASGAVPVVFPWAGAETVYDEEWIVDDAAAAAGKILELGDKDRHHNLATQALAEIQRISLDRVTSEWAELLSAQRTSSAGLSSAKEVSST